jgi:hypothetical protein
VSLVFPLVLAPRLGLSRTGFLFGMLNVAVALFTLRIFRDEMSHDVAHARGMVLAVLTAGFAGSNYLTHWAERGLFGDEIIHSETTPTSGWSSRAGRTISASTSTATCSSPRATNTAITRRWCTRCRRRCRGRVACW